VVAGCSCACGDSLFPLSTSTKAQSSSQNSHDHNRFYQFQSISPPFVASCTARVGSHTDNNVFVKFFGCIAPAIRWCMEPARPRAVSVKSLTRRGRRGSIHFAARASRLQSRLDYNRGTLINHFGQFDYVLVTHPHAAVTRRRTNFVLVSGSMNVDEAVACICIVLVQSIEPQNT
jgi:hypothetical protein